MQPLIVNLNGKKVVIVGGGKIAARKARTLDEEGPAITFIAPTFIDEVIEISQQKGYTLIQREADASDFSEAILVILATNDRNVNQALAKAVPLYQLVCVVDDQEDGNVQFPATVRRGHLQLAVSSGGASPKLTRKLKRELEEQFDESWEGYTAFLSECRTIIKKLPIPSEEKNEKLAKLLDDRFRMDLQAQQEELEQLKSIKQ